MAANTPALTTRERAIRLARTLTPFAHQHQSYLIHGIIATLTGVVLRVALPWPMKSLLKPWLRDTSRHIHVKLPKWLPEGMDPVLAAGLILLVIMLLMGLADLRKRLAYARFAIAVSRDLRAQALRAAGDARMHLSPHRAGDMVSRILGDSARIKTGIRGFLIHVTTNLVLLTAVSVVLVKLHWGVGLIFLAAVMLTIGATLVASDRIATRTKKIREKEAKLAEAIHRTWLDHAAGDEDYARVVKVSPGSHDASITKIQGFAAWTAHVVFGLAMLFGALLAEHELSIGAMKPATVLVFVVYALMVRTPLIQLARQGVRLGKVVGSSDRIVAMLDESRQRQANTQGLPELSQTIIVRDVVVHGGRAHGDEPVFGAASLRIQRGDRIYIQGDAGAGKTTLLELLAHVRIPDSGQILWDDIDFTTVNPESIRDRVSYAPSEPSWSKRSLGAFLGLPDGEVSEPSKRILAASRVAEILERLPMGLETIATSHDFSLDERRALAICRSALKPADLYLWDDADRIKLADLVSTLNNAATVVVAGHSEAPPGVFGRVVRVNGGRLRSTEVNEAAVPEV